MVIDVDFRSGIRLDRPMAAYEANLVFDSASGLDEVAATAPEAARLYRAVLRWHRHARAMVNLGNVLYLFEGNADAAIALWTDAIAVADELATSEAHYNIACVLHDRGSVIARVMCGRASRAERPTWRDARVRYDAICERARCV
jgi:tetratricopeptide (TPR) repeat protein